MQDLFGWHEVAPEKLKEIRAKLGDLEKKTWGQILLEEKHRNHSVQVGDLIPEIQKRLTERQLLLESLISLRLSGKERLWGYLSHWGAMEVLWWDPEHEICPSPKKHT